MSPQIPPPANRLILAIDATQEFGSLALARGAMVLEEMAVHGPNGFAHILYARLDAILRNHGLRTEDINCFAAASGPGSFTGVRIGLACIKGLAETLGKPAVAISNLQALSTFGTAALRAPVLDARRGEIYGAIYNAAAQLVEPEMVDKAPAWLESLGRSDYEFVTSDTVLLRSLLAGTKFGSAPLTQAPHELAAAVAGLAAVSEPCDPAGLDANYVRRSDAELFWKE